MTSPLGWGPSVAPPSAPCGCSPVKCSLSFKSKGWHTALLTLESRIRQAKRPSPVDGHVVLTQICATQHYVRLQSNNNLQHRATWTIHSVLGWSWSGTRLHCTKTQLNTCAWPRRLTIRAGGDHGESVQAWFATAKLQKAILHFRATVFAKPQLYGNRLAMWRIIPD